MRSLSKILHIVRQLNDERAIKTLKGEHQAGHTVTLLLLHDAVLWQVPWQGKVFACRDDVLARTGKTKFPLVDYDQTVKLIFEHDKVISW